MQLTDDKRWILSPTDLVNHLGCRHLSALNRAAGLGQVPAPPKYDDAGLEALRKRGDEHEAAYLDQLVASGRGVVAIDQRRTLPYAERVGLAAADTVAALRAGADVIYQACLTDGYWTGWADFLVRVDLPSTLGDYSYEVVDTKLAREAKGGALLQILLYSDLLAQIQGIAPAEVHLQLGGPSPRQESFRVADYAAYFRQVRRGFLDWHGAPAEALAHAPDPVAHCDLCRWRKRCADERREVDHLSLVAGITRRQRDALRASAVETMEALGDHPLPPEGAVEGIRKEPLRRIREQARVQVQGRREARNVHELLLPWKEGEGLAALPAPSPGDLFLDLEGAPFALKHGLEFLFGWADAGGNYEARWAIDRAGEKAAFEEFVELVIARRRDYPDLHVYHYAPYERTALSKLMGFHATREGAVDAILRGEVLVDLYRVVRQGLRASVESYSIKKMEPFYGYGREVALLDATKALVAFNAWLELGGERDAELEERIEGYNRDDVISTVRLRDWLEILRAELEDAEAAPVPRPVPSDGAPDENTAARDAEIDALVERLTAGVPAELVERSDEQQARWLMAHLLEFHRREDKVFWWEFYHRVDFNDEELIEDRTTLGGLEYVDAVGVEKQSIVHRYRFPHQEHGIKVGMAVADPAPERARSEAKKAAREAGDPDADIPSAPAPGSVVDIDEVACTIDLKRGKGSMVPHPAALVPKDNVKSDAMKASLLRLGHAVADYGVGDENPYPCAVDLLMRCLPRAGQLAGADLVEAGEEIVDAAVRLAEMLDRSVLPIQGPPGAGKTFTATRVIVDAVRRGLKVGVTANSHAVITKVVDGVCELAEERGIRVSGVQRADEGAACAAEVVVRAADNAGVLRALADGANLVAGTAWLWSREDMAGAVDLLVIDEAGQFSLANALAVAPAAKSLVLVGDPQQLDQPLKGTHPPGVAVSCLEHLVGEGVQTVPADRGLFLDQTWRMHPGICAFTSEMFYDGKLEGRPDLARQAVAAAGAITGSGLRLVRVDHGGNTTDSPEEAASIADVVTELTAGGTWTDREGAVRPLGIDDILIVAPYNAQVGLLKEHLPEAHVGTVDKFQGQEAPVVIYSMTSSSAEEAPRGMGFLYSANRLNVATSRARCLAVVVAAPALFAPECHTPAQMRLANAFCRFREMAGGGDS